MIPVEQKALVFERHRGSSSYNDYGIGGLLLSTNDALEKFSEWSRVINPQFKATCEGTCEVGGLPCHCVKELSYPAAGRQ